MPRPVEMDLGIAGLALLRNWLVGDEATADRAVDDVRRVIESEAPARYQRFSSPEIGVSEGYSLWSETYDSGPNPLFPVEAVALDQLLAGIPPGQALDAACGTGRQAALLSGLGHTVIGVDASPEMLARARTKLPDVDFRVGTLDELPLPDRSIDVVICSLALTHLPDLLAPLQEFARVLRPGGKVILTDAHPVIVTLGSQTQFWAANKKPAWFRNYTHWPSDYLRAFRHAGLHVEDCVEAHYRPESVAIFGTPKDGLSFETVAKAWEGLPAVLGWRLTPV